MSSYSATHAVRERRAQARYAIEPEKRTITRRPRFTGRRRTITLVVMTLLLVASGIAFALWSLRAPITGQVNVTEEHSVTWTSGVTPSTATSGGVINCAATLNGNDSIVVTVTGNAGEWCDVTAGLRHAPTSGDGTVKIQGVTFADHESLNVGFRPGLGCGLDITKGDGLPNAGRPNTTVTFRVEIDPAAEVGTIPADAEAGVTIVLPNDYVAASCPTV